LRAGKRRWSGGGDEERRIKEKRKIKNKKIE